MKELFTQKHPKLLDELHPTQNEGIEVSKLYENSGVEVTWQCRNNPKHIWKQKIGNRAVRGYGCPYCSGRLTLPEDSFASLFPSIATELHPSKNNGFDPYKYRPNSNKVVWWQCKRGHVWEQSIHHRVRRKSKCKLCRKIENSIVYSYPKIVEEWHPSKNKPLEPMEVNPSSSLKVWWQCSKDPSHEWKVCVSSRTFGKSACPKCKKNTTLGSRLPPLNEFSPELASQWHPTKNGDLKPSDVTAGSSQKVWWICSKNPMHEWPATINNRARHGKGCPFCWHKSPGNPERSLAIRFPNIAKQWHPKKNGGLTPSDVSYGSSRLIWWQCLKNKSHEWEAKVVSRTQRNRIQCPQCAESPTSKENSLLVMYPDIAAQWHPTRNELTPAKFTKASGKKAWWVCPENANHVWEAQIKNRTVLGSGCPHCFKEKNVIRLTEHLYDLTLAEIDCFHVFLSNLRLLRKLTNQKIAKNPRLEQPYYRMIFSSVITSLETYLLDAFFKTVSKNDQLLQKLIETTPEFSKKQYSLTEVIDWHKNLRKKTTEYLFNIIWHNLSKVQNMYENVLGAIFPEDNLHLYKAINIRHDLVHRSGRTKAGAMHRLTKKQLLQLIDNVESFVVHIDTQLKEKKSEQ